MLEVEHASMAGAAVGSDGAGSSGTDGWDGDGVAAGLVATAELVGLADAAGVATPRHGCQIASATTPATTSNATTTTTSRRRR